MHQQKYYSNPAPGERLMLADASSNCSVLTYEVQQQVCLSVSFEATYATKEAGMQKLMTGNGDCWWQTIGYIDVLSCSPGTGNESGGIVGDVGGTTTGTTSTQLSSAVREVVNNMEDPCKNAALENITNLKVKSFLTGFYNNFLLPINSDLKVTFSEDDNLTVNSNIVPAYSTESSAGNWEIKISSNYYSNSNYKMSKEAWGIIIAHEILHILFKKD